MKNLLHRLGIGKRCVLICFAIAALILAAKGYDIWNKRWIDRQITLIKGKMVYLIVAQEKDIERFEAEMKERELSAEDTLAAWYDLYTYKEIVRQLKIRLCLFDERSRFEEGMHDEVMALAQSTKADVERIMALSDHLEHILEKDTGSEEHEKAKEAPALQDLGFTCSTS